MTMGNTTKAHRHGRSVGRREALKDMQRSVSPKNTERIVVAHGKTETRGPIDLSGHNREAALDHDVCQTKVAEREDGRNRTHVNTPGQRGHCGGASRG